MSLVDYINGLSLADDLKLLNQAVQDQQTSNYLDVAAVAVMQYDILLTIDQEVSLIWKARWSQGKLLYFITRYPVAVEGIFWLVYSVDVNASDCKFEAYLGIWGSLIFLIPLQIVVILRTIAIWDRKRTIVVILWLTLFATDTVILATLSRVMTEFTFSMNQPIRPILGCNSGLLSLSPTTTIPAWVGGIAFETIIFLLTLVRAIRSYKVARTRLLTVLIRDGFAYYCILLALAISNLLLLSALPISRVGIATALTPVLRASYSVIGSRVVLNMRRAASAHLNLGTAQQNVKLVELSGSSSASARLELESGSGVGVCDQGERSAFGPGARNGVSNAQAEVGEQRLGARSMVSGSVWGKETNSVWLNKWTENTRIC